MISRIRGLFQRYAIQHRVIEVSGFSLSRKAGPVHGHVDRVVLRGRKATFIGWCSADRVLLRGRDGQVVIRPGILRQDVAQVTGLSPQVGFETTMPFGNGHFTVTCETGAEQTLYKANPIPAWKRGLNRSWLLLRFASTLLRISPALIRFWRTRDLIAGARIRAALGLRHVPEAVPLDPALFAPPPKTPPAPVPGAVTIVLPVYNAFDLLPEVLDRVVRHTDLPWHLILIEDCSSDPALRPWLERWVADQAAAFPDRIELILNAENKGFIGSVNSGLRRGADIGAPVVLLNSDAFVPMGWASRLIRTLLAQPHTASVTPMSNDAEIFSVPAICQRADLAPGQGDAIDAVARHLRSGVLRAEAPTGVGFCMALHIDYLAQVPQLDPVFGRGYGEEVDWCQKTRALGGRHLAAPDLFVEHRGGSSFGSAAKRQLIQTNNGVISQRYPTYDREVQSFIQADPLASARLALAVAWVASRSDAAVPIYLAHAMGGGAESYLQGRIRTDLEDRGQPAIILRVGNSTDRWQIEVISAQGMVAGTTDDTGLLETILAPLTRRHIVYSCGVGDRDPVALPDILLDLRGSGADGLEVLVHDYFMLSPSYTLLDQQGQYHGAVPDADADPAHQTRRPDGHHVTLSEWRAAWGRLIAAADRVVVFSPSSQALMTEAYPDSTAAVQLEPHVLLNTVPMLTRPDGPRRVIGVLGNIGYQKGAAVARDLGRLLETRDTLALAVIGNMDPAYPAPASVPVHGGYDIGELADLAVQYGITDWLIPSVWPETFSYTTHEALATGLPTYAFGIGGQGDAVAQAENGHIIDFSTHSDLAQTVLSRIEHQTSTEAA